MFKFKGFIVSVYGEGVLKLSDGFICGNWVYKSILGYVYLLTLLDLGGIII